MRIGFPKKVPAQIDQSCLLYYKMDESSGDIRDWSGNVNTGHVVTATYGATGKFGKALTFDGTNDYVKSVNTLAINTATTSCTVSAWIYFRGPNVAGQSHVVGNFPYYGFTIKSSTVIGAWLNGWSNNVGVPNLTNAWHHVACVYHANASAQPRDVYIDGIFQGQDNAIGGGNYNNAGYVRIGRDESWGGYTTAFDGLIDDVRIYNRAFTASEIKQHYMRGR